MTRDELEAVIWRHWPARGPEAGDAVDAILGAVDKYVLHEADTYITQRDAQTIADQCDDKPGQQGRRRSVLARATRRTA